MLMLIIDQRSADVYAEFQIGLLVFMGIQHEATTDEFPEGV